MITWNITDARPVEKLSNLGREDDEQTKVEPSRLEVSPYDAEKSVIAIALMVAIALSAVLALWRDPESMLWWLLVFLASSSWCCALGSFITDILNVAIEWIIEAFAYLRGLLANWRDAATRFIDQWIWSRFRTKQTEGGNCVKQL